MCDAVGPALVVPSPKLMLDVRALPCGSVEEAVEAVTLTGALPDPGLNDNCATGGCAAVTLTWTDWEAVDPALSVNVALRV